MFWRKKDVKKSYAEGYCDEWAAVVLTRCNDIEKKLNLILKELGKEYVPEKSVPEPAKLVNEQKPYISGSESMTNIANMLLSNEYGENRPKKKRGRPKGSKTKK